MWKSQRSLSERKSLAFGKNTGEKVCEDWAGASCIFEEECNAYAYGALCWYTSASCRGATYQPLQLTDPKPQGL